MQSDNSRAPERRQRAYAS